MRPHWSQISSTEHWDVLRKNINVNGTSKPPSFYVSVLEKCDWLKKIDGTITTFVFNAHPLHGANRVTYDLRIRTYQGQGMLLHDCWFSLVALHAHDAMEWRRYPIEIAEDTNRSIFLKNQCFESENTILIVKWGTKTKYGDVLFFKSTRICQRWPFPKALVSLQVATIKTGLTELFTDENKVRAIYTSSGDRKSVITATWNGRRYYYWYFQALQLYRRWLVLMKSSKKWWRFKSGTEAYTPIWSHEKRGR